MGPHLPRPTPRSPDRLRRPARRAQDPPAGDPRVGRRRHLRGHAGHLGGRRHHPCARPAVPRLLRTPRAHPRGDRDLRGRHHRRLPRHVRAGQGRRPGPGGLHPLLPRGHLVPVQDPSRRRRPDLAGVGAAAHVALGHRHHQCGQPDRRARRARGGRGGHRLGRARGLRLAPAGTRQPSGRQHRSAHRDHHLRYLPRVPARTTSTRPRSSWATRGRCYSGC